MAAAVIMQVVDTQGYTDEDLQILCISFRLVMHLHNHNVVNFLTDGCTLNLKCLGIYIQVCPRGCRAGGLILEHVEGLRAIGLWMGELWTDLGASMGL